jgi:hypothetical protein
MLFVRFVEFVVKFFQILWIKFNGARHQRFVFPEFAVGLAGMPAAVIYEFLRSKNSKL